MRADPNQDDFIINLEQDWQCRWWSREFGVAPERLRQAVREAGPLARNVRLHLRTTQPPDCQGLGPAGSKLS
jgi:hypothetical protein